MKDRVKEVLVDFSQTTTISGLYFINKYQSTLSRLLWVFISLFLLTLCTWQCTVSFSNYFARPTIVKTRMTTKELTFPAVTFCSTNPYMASKIFKSERVKQLMHTIEKNAESIKEDVPTNSEKIANRVKRQVELTTTQSSGTVEAGEDCYDVSEIDMWTSKSPATTTVSTLLPIASVKSTPPTLATTSSPTSAGQPSSSFFVSSPKFDPTGPLVGNVDSSTDNNAAYDQEYDYDDGGNCTADSIDTTSTTTEGSTIDAPGPSAWNVSPSSKPSTDTQINTENLSLLSTVACNEPDSSSSSSVVIQTIPDSTPLVDYSRPATNVNNNESEKVGDYSEDDYEDGCSSTDGTTESPTTLFANEDVTSSTPDSSSSPSAVSSISDESTTVFSPDYRVSIKSANGDEDRASDYEYGSTSTAGNTESTTTPVASEILTTIFTEMTTTESPVSMSTSSKKLDTSQLSKKAEISVKSESKLWDNFFGKEAAKNNKLAYDVTAQDALLYVAQTESQDVLSSMSYQLNDIFVAGMFNSRRLAMSKIKQEHYPGIGNCFTFNNEGPYYMNAQPGRQRGLELELHLKPSEFLSQSLSPGFLLLIHSQEEPIFPDSDSIKISPNFETEIALLYICFRKCQQNWVIKNCGCADPSLPNVENTTYGYCMFGNRSCVEEARVTGADSSKTNCDCPLPCLTRHYKSIMTISRRRLTKEDSASNNTGSERYDDTTLKTSPNLIANVDVFFRTLNQITYERVPSYEMNALISDLAQYLGLWLGFSAITFFELIPFGYYVTRAALSGKKM